MLPECDEIHCKVQTVLSDFIEDDDLGPAPEQRGAPIENDGELDVTEVGQVCEDHQAADAQQQLRAAVNNMFGIGERQDNNTEQSGELLYDDVNAPEPALPPVQAQMSEFRQEYRNAIPDWTRVPFFSCQPFPHCSCPLICRMEERTLERIFSSRVKRSYVYNVINFLNFGSYVYNVINFINFRS